MDTLLIKQRISEFLKDRPYLCNRTTKNVAIALSVEASELLEHFTWIDDNSPLDNAKRNAIGEEIADVFIYLQELACLLSINLQDVVEMKIEKNKQKYPKNGGNYDGNDTGRKI